MPGRRDPIADQQAEIFLRHAGVRRIQQVQQVLAVNRGKNVRIVLQDGLERLSFMPFRMLTGKGVNAVTHEKGLHIERLLAPERAVVVKCGDPLGTGTNSGPPSLVTRSTKSRIARFDGPSFQEGKGSAWPCAGGIINPTSASTPAILHRNIKPSPCELEKCPEAASFPLGVDTTISRPLCKGHNYFPPLQRGGGGVDAAQPDAMFVPLPSSANSVFWGGRVSPWNDTS